jgi:hypothetical protein
MPPSKLPMQTLMKQARAFGLGVVFATQKIHVDLDYKGLSERRHLVHRPPCRRNATGTASSTDS